MRNDAIAYNEKYWNNHADLWFGTTSAVWCEISNGR